MTTKITVASGLAVLSALLLLGVAGNVGRSQKKAEGSSLGPVVDNPKEKLDEQRMAAATKGLDFSVATIVVTAKAGADRAKAVAFSQGAEKILATENVWFTAVGGFRDAVLSDPTYAPAYEGMSRAFLLEGDVEHSEKALRTALAKDPSFDKARFELGMARQMMADFNGALTVWKGLVAKNPGYPDAYARMSLAAYFAEDYPSAWKYLDEANRRKQNVPPQFIPLLKEVAPRP